MLLAPDEAVELGDQEDALEVLAEEQSTEIRDLAVLQGVDASPLGQPLELLQLVQDRAAQAEQLEALLDEEGEPEAEVYDLAEEVPPEMYAHLVPEEPSAAPMRDQPKTLIHVLQQTLTKKLPEFELGEDTGVGMLACVRRGVALLGPMRHFCRFARLEEGKLSEAMLEKESASLNMEQDRARIGREEHRQCRGCESSLRVQAPRVQRGREVAGRHRRTGWCSLQ